MKLQEFQCKLNIKDDELNSCVVFIVNSGFQLTFMQMDCKILRISYQSEEFL